MPQTSSKRSALGARARTGTVGARVAARNVAAAMKQGSQAPAEQDRRIVRTHSALRAALVNLMEERGFDQLSVGDLCTQADITRATFYNHFGSKEALLESLEADFMAGLDVFQERMSGLSLAQLATCVATKRPLPLLVELFDYLRGEGDFLHAVMGPGGDPAFAPRLRDAVCTNLVQSILHERYRNSTDPFVGYYVAFYASAYLGVITRWVETGMHEGSEDMARTAQRLLFIKPGESIKL